MMSCPGAVAREREFRRAVGGPGDDGEGEGGAKGVDEAARGYGTIEVLHDDGEVMDGERERGAEEEEEDQRQQQGEDQCQAVAEDLREFLAGLG